MKAKGTFAVCVLVGLLVIGLAGGCNRSRCVGLPLSLESGITINGTGQGQELPEGITIDPQELEFEFEICGLPTESDIRDELSGIPVLEQVTSHIEIVNISVLEATLIANRAWDFIESLSIEYIPSPVDGGEQDPIALGEATAPAGGFGTDIDIVLDPEFDFWSLMQDEEENTGAGCPRLRVTFVGLPPEESLTFGADVRVEVCVRFTR